MSPLSNLLSRGKEADADVEADVALGAEPSAPRPQVVVRVDLLPPEIHEAAAFRRGQVVRGACVAAAVAVVAVGSMLASQSVDKADAALAAETQRATELQREVQALSIVPETQLRLDTARQQVAGAMSEQVLWSRYLNQLAMRMPGNVRLTEMTVTQTVDAPPAGAAPSAASGAVSALGTPGIASITFTGEALTKDDVARFLDSLAKQNGNVDPYFSAVTEEVDENDRSFVTFNATVTVDQTAKSGNYLPKAGG